MRLFPEHGTSLVAPTYGLELFFSSLAKETWSTDFFFELLAEPMFVCSRMSSSELIQSVVMKTVFEKEDNAQHAEPVLVMQLAAREILNQAKRAKVTWIQCDELLEAFGRTVDSVSRDAAKTSHFDMYFWSSLFEPFFGAICCLKLLGKADNLRPKLDSLDMPHLLKKTLNGDMLWLLPGLE